MIVLGIESTAHTFGVAVISNKKVLSNIIKAYTTERGGIIPSDAARHHEEIKRQVLNEALEKAKLDIEDIELISVSNAPGLAPCLWVGVNLAKELSVKYDIPAIGVNHCIAHLEVGNMLTDVKDPVLLYTSGANTQIIAFENKKYRIFGETLDQGVGNFIDSFARYAGLGFPGGPKIERLARTSANFIELPYTVKGMDFSLSGILTNIKSKYDKGIPTQDLAYSLQETVFAMLIEVSERALAHTGKKELLLGGGVACNKRLQEMAEIMCRERNARCYVLPNEFNVDNGAMIAWLGLIKHKAQKKKEELIVKPYERTDDVDVNWK